MFGLQKCKNYLKNYLQSNKRIVCIGTVATVFYLLGYKLIPKTYATMDSYIKYWVILDFLLCVALAVKVKISDKWKKYIGFGALLIVPAFSFFSIEYAIGNEIFSMPFIAVVLNYLICLSVYLLFYFFSNSIRFSVSAGVVVFAFASLANCFVREFRGNSIRVSDVFAIRTAMNVAGGYEFIFSEKKVHIILMSIAIILLVVHIDYKERMKRKMILQRVAVALVWSSFVGTVFNTAYMEAKGLKADWWELKASAKAHGSLLDFTSGIPYLKVKKPENYTKKEAKTIELDGAKRECTELKVEKAETVAAPDIIVIMNESFSDLSELGNMELSEECLKEFYALKENVIRGNLSVPVLGGLTANTEFEFLTGFSQSFLPSGVMAFQNYVKDGTYNFAKALDVNGYYSIFMHPYYRSGWNRPNVYSSFGFDEQYYVEDYENQESLRGMITDSANYKEVIKRYETAKEKNEQVFLFNVTMQNHGGYETNAIDKEITIQQPAGEYPKAEEYLNLIKKSDEAFRELISYFEQQENPVVICMFGDHLPAVEDELLDTLLESSEGSDVEKLAKKYQTPFIVWTNYDIGEKEYENMSANYLQVLLSEVAGLPLNSYQKYLESLYEKYPVVNQFGVKDIGGEWYTWEEAQSFEEIKKYSEVQYKNLFEN